MATSPNYGWEEPDDTDLVKDGALSIRTMGNAIDSTLGTALNNKTHAGLVLVKTQTIGTGVSSVTVTAAFSATYDAYKIIISGGVGSASDVDLDLKFGSASSNYSYSYINNAISGTTVGAANSISQGSTNRIGYVGTANTSTIDANIELNNPFATKYTYVKASIARDTNYGFTNGVLKDSTSYTAFTILPTSGTLTGGTIYVYGYAKD